jgi:hypothetical protein
MSGVIKQQTLLTNDGTAIVVDSWLKEEDRIAMAPGDSNFSATCPVHGKIEESYVSIIVGFAVSDHAKDHHGGLRSPADTLEVGPSIQL